MKIIETNLIGLNDGPELLELNMDPEGIDELIEVLTGLSYYTKEQAFSMDFKDDVYVLPEDSDFRSDVSLLTVYFDVTKQPEDMLCVQKIYDKDDNSGCVESLFFTLEQVRKYLSGGKEKFKVTLDQKHTIWHRTVAEIEANSLEEAQKELIKAIEGDESTVKAVDINTEYIYDTAEMLSPKENLAISEADRLMPDDNEIDLEGANTTEFPEELNYKL
jgi:DNA-directed RNA polymerase subunit F